MKICRWSFLAIALLVARACAEEVEPVEAEGQTVDEPAVNEALEALKASASLVETFDGTSLDGTKWFKSSNAKYEGQDVAVNAHGLVLQAPAKHYGVGVTLDAPLRIDGDKTKELVVQYEVQLQNGLSCGGAYVKLLRAKEDGDFSAFDDHTPFVIMFGPDKCGANDKVHFIFQHQNPLTKEYEEKHLDGAPTSKSDKLTHLYSLVVRDDNTYEMLIDQQSVSNGTLLTSFTPAVVPPKEIEDPDDSKPKDWVDEAEIPDPKASKPADWDEDAPARIPDEAAVKPENWLDDEPTMVDDPAVDKPEDWDDEDDGEWVAPQVANPKCEAVAGCGEWVRPTIANPDYKGKWKAPMIANPAYKGEWKPRTIANPDYFNDEHPARLDAIGALAVEVWTMSEGISFDNFWLGHDAAQAKEFAALTWAPKHAKEVAEQEAQHLKEQKELEAQRAKEGSIVQKVKNLATAYVDFAKEKPVVGVGALFAAMVVMVLGTFLVCCGKSAPKEKAEEKEKASDKASDEEDEKKDKDSSASEEESEGKPKMRQRKKAPVVKDD